MRGEHNLLVVIDRGDQPVFTWNQADGQPAVCPWDQQGLGKLGQDAVTRGAPVGAGRPAGRLLLMANPGESGGRFRQAKLFVVPVSGLNQSLVPIRIS